MVKNIQGKMEMIGKSGCYFLSLLYVTNNLPNALPLYDKFIEKGWMESDCFIKDPASIVSDLTGKRYMVYKNDTFKKADIAIAYFYNPKTKLHHFVVVDNKSGEVKYDPLDNSNTVANGKVESYRLFYEA